MRVTGNRMIELAANATAANQSKAAAASAEASSGLRVQKASDDPEAWAAAQRAKSRQLLSSGASAALETGRERLELTDGALAGVGEAVSAIRQLALQGANASYTAEDRAGLGIQVRALFGSAIASANSQTVDGEYVLAGTRSNVAPFSATGVFAGDSAARELATTESETAFATISGHLLTAANGVDVLPLFDRVARALETNDVAALQSTIQDLDTATKQVGLARARTGGTINVLSAALSAHDDLGEHLASEVSRAVEIDLVTSASNLAKATQALEASRAITTHIVALVDPTK